MSHVFILFTEMINVGELEIIYFPVSWFLLASKNPQKDLFTVIRKLGDKYFLYIYILYFEIWEGILCYFQLFLV